MCEAKCTFTCLLGSASFEREGEAALCMFSAQMGSQLRQWAPQLPYSPMGKWTYLPHLPAFQLLFFLILLQALTCGPEIDNVLL